MERRAAENFAVFKSCASYYEIDSPVIVRRKLRKKKRQFDYWKDERVKNPSSREEIYFRRRFRVPLPVFCKHTLGSSIGSSLEKCNYLAALQMIATEGQELQLSSK